MPYDNAGRYLADPEASKDAQAKRDKAAAAAEKPKAKGRK